MTWRDHVACIHSGASQLKRKSRLGSKLKLLDVEFVLAEVVNHVVDLVQMGGTVRWPGFGVFRLSGTKARTVFNVATGKPMKLAARKRIAFRASKEWRAL